MDVVQVAAGSGATCGSHAKLYLDVQVVLGYVPYIPVWLDAEEAA